MKKKTKAKKSGAKKAVKKAGKPAAKKKGAVKKKAAKKASTKKSVKKAAPKKKVVAKKKVAAKKVAKKATPKKSVKKVAPKKKVVAPKPVKAKAKVAKKPAAKKTKQSFPGYPHYPAKDDITRPENKFTKTPLNDDDDAVFNKPTKAVKPTGKKSIGKEADEKGEFPFANDDNDDVTNEDLDTLGDDNLSDDDDGDDAELKKRVWPVDMSGDDLDVPGAEDDDADEAIGSEDEENNSYSIGGDRHDDLEEDNG